MGRCAMHIDHRWSGDQNQQVCSLIWENHKHLFMLGCCQEYAGRGWSWERLCETLGFSHSWQHQRRTVLCEKFEDLLHELFYCREPKKYWLFRDCWKTACEAPFSVNHSSLQWHNLMIGLRVQASQLQYSPLIVSQQLSLNIDFCDVLELHQVEEAVPLSVLKLFSPVVHENSAISKPSFPFCL